MNRFSRAFLSCVLAAAAIAALFATAGPASAVRTPDAEILVLINNLEEAFTRDFKDLKNNFEVDNFAERVRDIVPEDPDVVLLQEVNYQTSQLAAERLTARLGSRYAVIIRPRRNTTVEYPTKQVHTETAILINKSTMKVEDKGGFINTSYPLSASAPGQRVQVRRHALAMVSEKATGIKVPLVSVHYAQVSSFKTEKLSNEYRGKWSRAIESKMAKKYNADSSQRAAVIGGDFNASRCVRGSFASCVEASWWKVFNSSPHNYTDTLRVLDTAEAGVDVIWSQGTPLRGTWDENGDFKYSDKDRFYSDHRFRWVVVTPKTI